jgi:hypothetical protein
MDIKDGYYFSYSWKSGKGPSTDPYWCMDRRCVARQTADGEIVLIDTHNYWPYDNGKKVEEIFTFKGLDREYSNYINQESFDLEYICNLNEYKFVPEYDKDDYDETIYVGYQCTKQWAIPKEAKKSRSAILKKLQAKLDEAEYDRESAERRIAFYKSEIKELEGHQ